jgi:DNA-directed RNA polymerase alpha subunit
MRARNAAIVEAHERGEAWAAIGQRFGISAFTAAEAAKKHKSRLAWEAKSAGLDGLSVRSRSMLSYMGAQTPAAVAAIGRAGILDAPNLGIVSADEIAEWLAGHGLEFKDTTESV